MQKIVPHLWFDSEAREAAELYRGIFADSEISNVTTLTDTPSGDCDVMMASGSREQIDRVTEAFLPMKKFDLAELRRAYRGA